MLDMGWSIGSCSIARDKKHEVKDAAKGSCTVECQYLKARAGHPVFFVDPHRVAGVGHVPEEAKL